MTKMKIIILNKNEIELKSIEHTDANDLFYLVDNCRNYLRPWLPWVDSTKNISDIINFIDNITNEIERPFTIFYKQQIVGLIAPKNYDEKNFSCEIGYWIGEKFQNNGIMYNSCKLLISYLFEKLNLKRIEIGIAIDNIKSKKVPQKLGFHKEGIKKSAEYINNHFQDHEIYSLINEGWDYQKTVKDI